MWSRQEEQRLRQNYRRQGRVWGGWGGGGEISAAAGIWRRHIISGICANPHETWRRLPTLPPLDPTLLLHIFHSGSASILDSLQGLLRRANEHYTPITTTPIASHHNTQCIRQNFCNCQNDQIITIMEDKFTSYFKPRNTATELSP